MSTNFHDAWIDYPNVNYTVFNAASMNPAIAALDLALSYLKNVIVHCDGEISYSAGTLTWSGTIRIHFNDDDGNAIQNTVAAGNIALSDDQFAYVTLSQTNNAALTVSAAGITTGSASNYITNGILVLAFRNDTRCYPVALVQAIGEGGVSGPGSAVEDNLASFGDTTGKVIEDSGVAITDVADAVANSHIQNTDQYLDYGGPNEVSVAQILASLASESDPTLTRYLDGLEQEITCAANVTIDWSLGATAYMVLDRATSAITLSNGENGKVYRLRITQGAGSQSVTWVSTIKWRGGSEPTLSGPASSSDFITFVRSNGVWYADAALNFPN